MTNISLVGFSAAGKSTVGKQLSEKLNLQFIDLDKQIEKKTAQSIDTLIVKIGIEKFRLIEARCLQEQITKDNFVLATGGGSILNPASRKLLQARSQVVWLQVEESVVHNRMQAGNAGRKSISALTLQALHKEFERRQPIYSEVAGIHIDTTNSSVPEIVNAIAKRLKSD